jgi:hypothetical protein
MKQDRRIMKREGGKKRHKKNGKFPNPRNFYWEYAEDPIVPEKDGPPSNNHNYRSRWPRKDRL